MQHQPKAYKAKSMGKVSPHEKGGKRTKQTRPFHDSSSKYLKPGALAQLRSYKSSTVNSYRNFRKKRVAILRSRKTDNSVAPENKVHDKSPLMLSPVNLAKQNCLSATPKTPRIENCQSDSRLESLPMDLLVKILCHLHHDQLKAVFHISQRIRKAVSLPFYYWVFIALNCCSLQVVRLFAILAMVITRSVLYKVLIARQFHFNYTTPDRSRQEMLCTTTPCPSDHWPFLCRGDGKGMKISSPHAPKAPRHGPRPPSRLKVSEMRQVAVVLFKESAFPPRCMMPSVLPKPLSKSLASNRVLFYEDELCQAVAQNKLR